MNRRGLLKRGLLAAPALILPRTARAQLWAAGAGVVPTHLGQVATASRNSDSPSPDTTNKQLMSRTLSIMRASCPTIQLVYANWMLTFVGEATSGGNATITASIEYPVGTFTQVKWSAASSVTFAAGTNAISDPVTAPPNGASFFVRTWASFANGSIYHGQIGSGAVSLGTGVGEAQTTSPTVSDQTMGGTVGDNRLAAIAFRPVAIIGQTSLPCIGIIGDSRGLGDCDIPDATTGLGEVERSLVGSYGILNNGAGGNAGFEFVASHTLSAALVNAYCTHVVCQYGINDLDSSHSAATTLADLQSCWALFPTKKVWQTTLPPWVNTTDSLMTLGNQSNGLPVADSERTGLNTSIRGIPGGLTGGMLDVASAVESSLNSGKWIVNGTPFWSSCDGIHETPVGCAAIVSAGVINPAVFT